MRERTAPAERPQNKLEIDVDALSFKERQALMRDLEALQTRLQKEVELQDDGIEMIDGTRIHIEPDGDEYIIRGLEYLHPEDRFVVDYGTSMPRYPDKAAALKKIKDEAASAGYTIIS